MPRLHPVHSEDDQPGSAINMDILRCTCLPLLIPPTKQWFVSFDLLLLRHWIFWTRFVVNGLEMSTNCSQTQEFAGKLDLMRLGKMSVHQWINTPSFSTSIHNTFTHDCAQVLVYTIKVHNITHSLYLL